MPEAVLTIESIAAGGDGVARDGSLVVFVPRAAPGDRGLVSYAMRGGYARGRWRNIESSSPARVKATCSHYEGDKCGGCQIQHIGYDEQLRAKERIVLDALQRIGGRRDVSITMHPASQQWGYRRKLTLALNREGSGWRAGLHPYDAPASIFNLRECSITADSVLAAWKEILRHGDLLPNARSLRASVLERNGGLHFSVEGGESWSCAEELARACPSISSIWWTGSDEVRREMFAREGASAAGASFVQINESVSQELHAHVLDAAMRYSPATVVDAYCGSGELALDIARKGIQVSAIESDPDAVDAFIDRLPDGSRAITGKVETELDDLLPVDLVILNPPRAGVREEVTASLSLPDVVRKAIIYVSCNPATLARDLSRMPGYRIRSLNCFDMFPQTAHIETVCELVPEIAS